MCERILMDWLRKQAAQTQDNQLARLLQGWLGGHCLQTPDGALRLRSVQVVDQGPQSALAQPPNQRSTLRTISQIVHRRSSHLRVVHLFLQVSSFAANLFQVFYLKFLRGTPNVPILNIRASSNTRETIVY